MTDRFRLFRRAVSRATAATVVGEVYDGVAGDWITRVRYLGCGPLAGCVRVEEVEFALRTRPTSRALPKCSV